MKHWSLSINCDCFISLHLTASPPLCCEGAGVSSTCLRAKAGSHPGRVASLSQGHRARQTTHTYDPFSQTSSQSSHELSVLKPVLSPQTHVHDFGPWTLFLWVQTTIVMWLMLPYCLTFILLHCHYYYFLKICDPNICWTPVRWCHCFASVFCYLSSWFFFFFFECVLFFLNQWKP